MNFPNAWEANATLISLASSRFVLGDKRGARDCLGNIRKYLASTDRSVNRAYASIVESMILFEELRLTEAMAILQKEFERSSKERGPYSQAACLCASALCYILYENDQISECDSLINGRISIANSIGSPDNIIYINLAAARTAISRNDLSIANQILAKAQAASAHRQVPRIAMTLLWEQARVALLSGDPDGAAIFEAEASQLAPPDHLGYSHAIVGDIAAIRLQLIRAESGGVVPRLQSLSAQAKNLGLRRRWLKLSVLHAWALTLEQDLESATGVMQKALAVGIPAGFLRTFTEEGDVVTSLVKRAMEGSELRNRIPHLTMHHFEDAFHAGSPGVSNGPPVSLDIGHAPRSRLSTREREIIDIAARGLTNLEIAHCLSVTEPTVKWHLQNAFRKLGVSNRTEAIFMTRE